MLVEYIDADVIGLVRVIVGNHVTKVFPKLHPQKIFTAGSPEINTPQMEVRKIIDSKSKPSRFSVFFFVKIEPGVYPFIISHL